MILFMEKKKKETYVSCDIFIIYRWKRKGSKVFDPLLAEDRWPKLSFNFRRMLRCVFPVDWMTMTHVYSKW